MHFMKIVQIRQAKLLKPLQITLKGYSPQNKHKFIVIEMNYEKPKSNDFLWKLTDNSNLLVSFKCEYMKFKPLLKLTNKNTY